VRVLIAPDKFKDALPADAVAAALAAGVRDADPDADLRTCPLGDGGEGTGHILATTLRAAPQSTEVLDPLTRPRRATWWLQTKPPRVTPPAASPNHPTAIIELAEASGLALLRPAERDALHTTSYGTGQLLQAALAHRVNSILLCVGGSATVDGGAGCLQALGWQFLTAHGRTHTTPLTGAALADLVELHAPPAPPHLSLRILCDVDNPILGPRGAAPVFGPQKGASPDGVRVLERNLTHWTHLLHTTTGCDVTTLPGGGAAGGIAAGLAATLGATVVSGFDTVAAHVDLAGQLRGCDLCLTGEGRLDEQTAGGKVVAGVARLAAAQHVPTIAFVGATVSDAVNASALGVDRIVVITPPDTPLDRALAQTPDNLRRAARDAILTFRARPPGPPPC
jgi:glycerate kinase